MPRSKLAQAAGLTVVTYWVLMFVGTHVPIWGGSADALKKLGEGSDKAAHLLAFAGLAFLLCTAASLRWGFRQSYFAAVLGLLLAYSAVDEWTQALVSRDTDLNDWFADMLGVGLGLSAFSLVGEPLLLRLLPRNSPSDDDHAAC